ncbi:MAG: DUF3134 family protein [Acaryochloris sp. RU_4_1]|jgi:hypothetical protein|nr:DUF3134 family protein [Acaryochloris sp. RU_4_1]NJN37526.1 DUF3134 family protein [Acaryochloridaceae cyanobacterium CSU_3_4]NJR56024.1 DUF3134 family protein [Acaryochloris sp. CRU_2_0]
MVNPSLQQEDRFQISTVVAPRKNTSLYAWLEETGRFIEKDHTDFAWSTEDEELLEEYSGSDDDSFDLMAA